MYVCIHVCMDIHVFLKNLHQTLSRNRFSGLVTRSAVSFTPLVKACCGNRHVALVLNKARRAFGGSSTTYGSWQKFRFQNLWPYYGNRNTRTRGIREVQETHICLLFAGLDLVCPAQNRQALILNCRARGPPCLFRPIAQRPHDSGMGALVALT